MYVWHNVGFIAHPNTGSRSIRESLLKQGATPIGSHHDVCPRTLNGCRAVFCTIRNPYDLMASWYWRQTGKTSFNTWLRNTLLGQRHHEGPTHLGLFYGLVWATHVLRFENLKEDLEEVCRDLKLPHLEIQHVGKTNRPDDYSVLYDDETRGLIRLAYGEQLRIGKYDYERPSGVNPAGNIARAD